MIQIDDQEFTEKTSALISATVTRDDGATPLAGSQLLTLTLTLYNAATGAIINGRNGQNVLSQNGGAVSELGALTQYLGALDMVLSNQNLAREKHHALFAWTWNNGTAAGGLGKVIVEFSVVNALTVT